MYTIQAIPTVYKGRRYRSRLEAKWASFFDALGWRHEYEPFDFGSWSPDFAIQTTAGQLYVEVKPIVEAHDPTVAKMRAVPGEHLLLGVSPGIAIEENGGDPVSGLSIGWLVGHKEYDGGSFEYVESAEITRVRDTNGRACWGLISTTGSYQDRISGTYDGDHHLLPIRGSEISHLWARATNDVQWHKPRKAR